MYVKVRTMDGKKNAVITTSKTMTVQQFKVLVEEALEVEPKCQRLFFGGKQLVDDHVLFDYNINLNDVLQLMIRQEESVPEEKKSEEVSNVGSSKTKEIKVQAESEYFRVGDLVDVLDTGLGVWLEGVLVFIGKKSTEESLNKENGGDGLVYDVKLNTGEVYEESLSNIRPRARYIYPFSDLKVGMMVLANYNIDNVEERGLWYECEITRIAKKRRQEVFATLHFGGRSRLPLKNVKLRFYDDIFRLEERKLLSERGDEVVADIPKREAAPFCSHCKDRPGAMCRECGCNICGRKDEPDKQLMCDECQCAFHMRCLNPPLDAVPTTDDWYCPDCKIDENEIVKAGEKLKESKKKAKMASRTTTSTRDWGKGMACVGRTKVCTIVPPNHYGPVPGVEVGMCWKFRLQVSEAGIHRPHVAGIAGREGDGAYSIVLSGGYEDDLDLGESFYYTGSGGRDLSGNKRTAEQSCDQTLTRMNKALALNCNAPLNEKGAESKDWTKGKPIRVVRNYKAAKHSKYAPKEGNRYDGIYKVAKYYPQKGKSGFVVWRYVLKRDDPAPAPWTPEGKQRCAKLGLKMAYPDGYLEAMKEKEAGEATEGKKRKRALKEASPKGSPESKKMKLEKFQLDAEVKKLIKQDAANAKVWSECDAALKDGKQKYLAAVSEAFTCICCQEVAFEPVTTPCKHNFCMACMKRSFKAGVYSCPYCRSELEGELGAGDTAVNAYLGQALLKLFPGYDAGR